MSAITSKSCIPTMQRVLSRRSNNQVLPLPGPPHASFKTSLSFTTTESPRIFTTIRCGRSKSYKQFVVRAATGDDASALEETANLDKLIDVMLEATDAEMPQLIQQNIMQFDQKFFLRIATRCDSCGSDEQKQKLAELSGMTMRLLDQIVSKTSTKIDSSGEVLQFLCAAAADPVSGELEVPLNYQQLTAMRKAMSEKSGEMDESVVAQAYAWIRKSSEDGLDGMVTILQRVLQLYAAFALVPSASPSAAEGTATRALEEVLSADIEEWDALLAKAKEADFGTPFVEELQKKMEEVVLGMPNGSYSQRVLAEYLKEVEDKAKSVFEA